MFTAVHDEQLALPEAQVAAARMLELADCMPSALGASSGTLVTATARC